MRDSISQIPSLKSPLSDVSHHFFVFHGFCRGNHIHWSVRKASSVHYDLSTAPRFSHVLEHVTIWGHRSAQSRVSPGEFDAVSCVHESRFKGDNNSM